MALTAFQQALQTDILASVDPLVIAARASPRNDSELARLYNLDASPIYTVWRTSVSRSEIYNLTSGEATTWSWTIYKAQAVAEQNAWTQMFMGDQANFSQANLRAGIAAIFGAGNANNTHILAVSKRNATRAEKLLSVGSGTLVSPSNLGSFEGKLTPQAVSDAMGG